MKCLNNPHPQNHKNHLQAFMLFNMFQYVLMTFKLIFHDLKMLGTHWFRHPLGSGCCLQWCCELKPEVHHFWRPRARQSWMPHWCRSWILCTRCPMDGAVFWWDGLSLRVFHGFFKPHVAFMLNVLKLLGSLTHWGWNSRIMNLYSDDITYIITYIFHIF